jgi:formate/nitrite transporter FocA (FNT family)
MKKALADFVYAVFAGMSIALGGVVFLSLDNKVLGALFFTVGLFTASTFSRARLAICLKISRLTCCFC